MKPVASPATISRSERADDSEKFVAGELTNWEDDAALLFNDDKEELFQGANSTTDVAGSQKDIRLTELPQQLAHVLNRSACRRKLIVFVWPAASWLHTGTDICAYGKRHDYTHIANA